MGAMRRRSANEALAPVKRIRGHPPENDEAVAGRGDPVAVRLEAMRQAELLDLAFDQSLRRLRQRLLRLANAHRRRAGLRLAKLDQKLSEKMRFSGTSSAENP